MTEKDINKLSVSQYYQLEGIFDQKHWDKYDECFDEDNVKNFIDMLSFFEPEEQNLILDLTQQFVWIKENEYISLFCKAFEVFLNNYDYSCYKNVVICPLLAEEDINNPTKSTYTVLYKIKTFLKKIQFRFKNCGLNISLLDTFTVESIKESAVDNLFCLVDDFIGTGDTAISAVNYLHNCGVNKEFVILSLLAMEQGIDNLKRTDIHAYAAETFFKAMANRDKCDIELMQRIENKIKVKEEYEFGYGHSEALIKLVRTPNNTFPVFWLSKKQYTAPFWR